MSTLYQVKNNNKGLEYYSNLALAKHYARQYLAERVKQREPNALRVGYGEMISYSRGCAVLVLTATVYSTRTCAPKIFRQNIKCPRLNNNLTCADGSADFYECLKHATKYN